MLMHEINDRKNFNAICENLCDAKKNIFRWNARRRNENLYYSGPIDYRTGMKGNIIEIFEIF